jgi:hypothetical protein
MQNNMANLIVYGSPADSYGNDILSIAVYEDNVLKANLTASGGTVRLNASKTITFNVTICLNNTLVSSQNEAVQYTRVYLNITGVVTNAELTNVNIWADTNFYYLIEKYTINPNTLIGGQTYECTFKYQAYY